jgi:hypothetical protein
MNRKIILVFVTTLTIALVVGHVLVRLNSRERIASDVTVPGVARLVPDVRDLSIDEREALRSLILQVVRWRVVTEEEYPYCENIENGELKSGQKEDRRLNDLYREFTNKDVSVQVEVDDYWIRVYVIELKIWIFFDRDETLGFAASRPERLCGPPVNMRVDEVLVIRIPELTRIRWTGSRQRQSLLIDDIVENIRLSECTPERIAMGYFVDLEIPDFQPGDPQVWVYLNGMKESEVFDGKSVVFLRMKYDESEIVNSTSLPVEVAYFSRKIRQYPIFKRHLTCQKP